MHQSEAASVHIRIEGLSIIIRVYSYRSIIIIFYNILLTIFYALTPGLHCFDFHLNSRPQILEQHIEHKYTVEL